MNHLKEHEYILYPSFYKPNSIFVPDRPEAVFIFKELIHQT